MRISGIYFYACLNLYKRAIPDTMSSVNVRAKSWRMIGGVLILIIVSMLLFSVVVSESLSFVCDNTGSRYHFTQWPFGIRTNYEYYSSPLEEFMIEKYPSQLRHQWSQYSNTGKNIIGQSVSFACGNSSTLLVLRKDILHLWISRHSDQEVRNLYVTLTTGDLAKAESEVNNIIEDDETD